MGCMVTRGGLARHAYAAGNPAWVTSHALAASAPGSSGGRTQYPVTAPVATFAADGAPFYNSGYLPGYPSLPLAGIAPLALGPRAAQIDLSDPASWDRPVYWPPSAQ